VIVDAGTATAHTLVTLHGVQATDISTLLQTETKEVKVEKSGAAANGSVGTDLFVFRSLAQHDDTINHFTLGQDHISFKGHGVDASRLSLVASSDGSSTNIVVDASTDHAHTLATLDGVHATDLSAVLQQPADHHHGASHENHWFF
jgi:hypothetical protein